MPAMDRLALRLTIQNYVPQIQKFSNIAILRLSKLLFTLFKKLVEGASQQNKEVHQERAQKVGNGLGQWGRGNPWGQHMGLKGPRSDGPGPVEAG